MSDKCVSLDEEISHQDDDNDDDRDAPFHHFYEGEIRLLVRRIVIARGSCVFEFAVVGHHSPPNLAPDSRKNCVRHSGIRDVFERGARLFCKECRNEVKGISKARRSIKDLGFLGAGTIFVSGRRHQVHGLTTAASVWVIAAVGVAVGCDRFLLATGASILILIILHVLVKFEPPQRSLWDEPQLHAKQEDSSGGDANG